MAGLRRKAQQIGQIAGQFDGVAPHLRLKSDLADQTAQNVDRLGAVFGGGEGDGEGVDLGAVQFGEIGVKPHRRSGRRRQRGLHLGLARLKSGHLVLHRSLVEAVLDRLDDTPDGAIDADDLLFRLDASGLPLRTEPIDLLVVGANELLGQRRGDQMMTQAVKHRSLQRFAADGQAVGASALVAGGRAAIVGFADQHHAGAAHPAFHQTREEVARPPRRPVLVVATLHVGAGRTGGLLLTGLHLLPELIVDDAQIWPFGDDQIVRTPHPGHPLPLRGGRVADEFLPIPHQSPDVELVVQDAGAALAVAVDSRLVPSFTTGAGNPFGIEGVGDGAGARAVGVVAIDLEDDCRLVGGDLPLAAVRYPGSPGSHSSCRRPTGRPRCDRADRDESSRPAV